MNILELFITGGKGMFKYRNFNVEILQLRRSFRMTNNGRSVILSKAKNLI